MPSGADGCVLLPAASAVALGSITSGDFVRVPVLAFEERYLAALLEWALIEGMVLDDPPSDDPPPRACVGTTWVRPMREDDRGVSRSLVVLGIGEATGPQAFLTTAEARGIVALLRAKPATSEAPASLADFGGMSPAGSV
jgi:hypothetical protein